MCHSLKIIHGIDLQTSTDFIEYFVMRIPIDFSHQYLLSTGNRQGRDFSSQCFFSLLAFLLNFSSCCVQNTLTFLTRIIFGYINNLIMSFLCLIDEFLGFFFTLTQNLSCSLFCKLKFMITLFCFSQAICDLLGAFIQRVHDRWPDILHGEDHKQEKKE